MPHLIVEHSANVEHVPLILEAVHAAALGTGLASIDALRTRAACREGYVIGDRHPDNAFIALTARLGPGRSGDEKQLLIDALMTAIEATVGEAADHMMLSVEIQEIDPAMRLNHNHLRAHIAARTPTT
ncbi:MAG: 5-carboxymethyl-2-hydroxymuconate isomerase [Ilumatobacter sp.]|jgi:5-carboxymethyl-2-hydroxymuconate isomerase